MKSNFYKRFPTHRLCAAVTALIAAVPAGAETTLEEVVVTANKRETGLMETAAAVSAFDSKARDELGLDGPQDLAVRSPSLTIAPSRVSIRGVGRPNVALGSDPGVGLYWDGVYNTETDIFTMSNFLDIERVEVLRGPQGTLYGRNSIGGAINLVSKQPDSEEWGTSIVAELGNYGHTVGQVLTTGPVTEKLSVLAAISDIRRDGFQENIYNGDDYDNRENQYGTISLRHETTDNWTNTVKVMRAQSDSNPSNGYTLEPFATDYVQEVRDAYVGTTVLNFPGMYPGQNFANMHQGMTAENPGVKNSSQVSIDFTPTQTSERDAVFFTSELDTDSFSLKYTAGHSNFDFSRALDADLTASGDSGLDWNNLFLTTEFGPLPVSLVTGIGATPSDLIFSFEQQADFTSHELQLSSDLDGPVNFIGGLYYYSSDEFQDISYQERNAELMAVYGIFGSFIGQTVNPDGYLYKATADLETTSTAVYGQMDWNVTDDLVVTLGARYSKDEKSGNDLTFAQYVGDPSSPFVSRSESESWDQPTWKLGLDYTLSEDQFLYGFVATGYRSGGFNFLQPTASTDVDMVEPETLTSTEIGYRGSFADNRVNLSASVYHYAYEDMQVLKQTVINGVGLASYENAAEASATGFETELVALLTKNLMLSGTYSYNNTSFENFSSADLNACALGPRADGLVFDDLCIAEQNLTGNSFPLSPEHKASANLTYSWEAIGFQWSATGSYLYTGEQYMTAFNRDDYDLLDSSDRIDLRLNVASLDDTWEVTGFVKNLSDDRHVTYRERPSTVTQTAVSTLSDPRLVGLRLKYNF
ncbi:TonB-dependent receptor [Microbulbifer agarilyticus]|uniref:TonB-dependent receptor n=1 Tax=Microbulbifer agarilyticus TaxID=260552 RepID=UPI001C977FEF|nr:TonB-dependent receptor [Microbulbifer agarilyticus]MBY6190920.1 TonB-dependent receptor [Microbulbifer agarilyticus]